MDLRKAKEKAAEAFSKGKFAKAAELYEEYCEGDPKDLQARLRMGDAWAKSNQKEKAIAAYRSAAEGFAKEGFLPRAIAASKLILELDPSHKGVQQMLADLYARRTSSTGGDGKGRAPTRPETPAPFHRKDAIDLPPDDAPAPMAAAALEPPAAPSPFHRKDAIELPPDDGPVPMVADSLDPPRAPSPLNRKDAIELPPDDAPPEPVSPEDIELDVEAPPKRQEPAHEPSVIVDLSAELPPELQIQKEPPKAPPPPPRAEARGPKVHVIDEPLDPVPEPPPPAPPRNEPAPVPLPSADLRPSGRIWLPPALAQAPETQAAPAPEPVRAPTPLPIRPSPVKSDIEVGLAALSRFDELEMDDAGISFPMPPLRAPEAARVEPKAPSPPPAAAPPAMPSFTELELEGDSLLHAVEAAARAGSKQAPPAEEITLEVEEPPEAAAPGALPKIPLFSDLAPEAFIELFERCPLRKPRPGERIIEQGSVGDSFFVICAGSVKVYRTEDGNRRDLATLEEGAFFGEVALLSDAPRTASVEAAAEDTQLLEISAPVLAQLSHRYPQVAQALKKFCRQRLLANVMNTSALFKPFGKKDRRDLVGRFRARDVQRGDIIIREGAKSDGLYVVLSGEVEVKKSNTVLARLKEGEVFGEMSLLQKTPTTATVAASKRTSLLRLPREDFDAVVLSHPQILVLISELTDDRRKHTEAILSGAANVGEEGLMLV